MLRRYALAAIEGRGLPSAQWEQQHRAFHVKRRLTDEEKHLGVGEVCDLRGTDEAMKRFQRMRRHMSPMHEHLALRELAGNG